MYSTFDSDGESVKDRQRQNNQKRGSGIVEEKPSAQATQRSPTVGRSVHGCVCLGRLTPNK